MERMIISIEPSMKKRAAQRAKAEGIAVAAVVRKAMERYLELPAKGKGVDEVLERTFGIWKHGDGLRWQRKMRA